ncbi:LacI family DNA-binding transcriptional regulator [Isoptericola cucumis]|uniref:LacI family DNA-binding transcriptional regulator n=1 Tax=Isoptericola cucumis TaxID=1776856 RepID=UPI001E2A62FA|nr:LacI family DNA-binding transcriptional regulator [Isoptericola cucumis]
MAARITIAEIAARAGVSAPTVSRVLNQRGDVAADTRERVEHLLAEHGYRRRGAPAPRPWTLIDLVFDDIDSPWALEVLRGVEDEAHGLGAGTVVSAVHGRAAERRRWLDNVRGRESGGAVLVTTGLDAALRAELQELRIPVVVVDPAGGADLGLPTVGATDWAGGRAATQHLLDLGHTRIAHVAGRPDLWCSRARLDGYRAALDAAGVDLDRDLVATGAFDYRSGFEVTSRWLADGAAPTAVFAASDQMALGVYEALRQTGRRVPDDVSVVGFDDLQEAQWSSPPLTTVRQPLDQMGRLAVRTLRRITDGEDVASPRVELATELVVRASTAPPRTA